MAFPVVSNAVRQGAFGWVVPQRCRAASREGGQLVIRPKGSPLSTFISFPSGFGWFGSGCCTKSRAQWNGKCQSLENVQVTLNRLFHESFSPSFSSRLLLLLLCFTAMLSQSSVGFTKNNYHHFRVLISCYSKDLATWTEFESLVCSFSTLKKTSNFCCLFCTSVSMKATPSQEALSERMASVITGHLFCCTKFSTGDEDWHYASVTTY